LADESPSGLVLYYKNESKMKLIVILQIVSAILLIIVVLLQQRSASLGGAFGGEGSVQYSKRGVEKFLFIATIVLAVIFVAIAIINVIT